MKLKKIGILLIVFLAITACEPETPGGGGITEGTYLFMTDTYHGNVFLYDIENGNAIGSSLFSTDEDCSDEIYFYNNIGYIAVGTSYSGNNPGVYYFDPRAAVPEATRIGDAISAQAIAFYSDTKAYVTDANWGVSAGVYTFNPQDPAAGLSGPITGTTKDAESGRYLQEIIIGTDGNVYVSDYNDAYDAGCILKIDPSDDSVTEITLAAGGTTGLEAVEIAGTDYVFIARTETWDYSDYLNPVLLDAGGVFILDCENETVTTLSETAAAIIEYDSINDRMYALDYSNTYYIDVNVSSFPPATPVVAQEIQNNSVSFGGSDLEIYGGYVYISNYVSDEGEYVNSLYIVDTATQALTDSSPVSVMTGIEGITGLAVYEY